MLGDSNRVIEYLPNRRPNQRGRHHPEVGKHRVTAADVGPVLEDAPKATLPSEDGQAGARVGDGDELFRTFDAVPEVIEVAESLDGGPGLAGYEDERAGEIKPGLRLADLLRVGAIEHDEVEHAGRGTEGFAEDLGTKAGAAHAKKEDVLETIGDDGAGEGLEFGQFMAQVVGDSEPSEAVDDLRGFGFPDGVVSGPDPLNGAVPGEIGDARVYPLAQGGGHRETTVTQDRGVARFRPRQKGPRAADS